MTKQPKKQPKKPLPPELDIVAAESPEHELVSAVEKATQGKVAVRTSWQAAEKMVHATGFEYYYNLGDKRSLAKVAQYMKVNIQTVEKWSSKFQWQKRVAERDMLRLSDDRPHSQADINKTKKAVLDYLKSALGAYVEYDEVGNIKKITGPKLKSVNEIKTAMDVYMDITGERMKEDTLKKVAANQGDKNGVNIQFVIKGR